MADLKIKIGVEADASGAEKVKKGLSDVEAAAQKASKSTGVLKSALDGIKSDAFANLTISLRGLSSVISSATRKQHHYREFKCSAKKPDKCRGKKRQARSV